VSARSKRRAAAFVARTSAPAPLDAPLRPVPAARFDRLDALRGVAMLWMAAFHFSFDLNYFRFIREDFYRDPLWTVQRMCIVTVFMLCVGAGQGIAAVQGQSLARFWRRVAQIAGCALLVSLGSWLMFPRSFISFGVLHAIALMLVVVRFTTSWGAWRWPLGLALVLLPLFVGDPFFDTRWTNWVGLTTHKPVTEDYAPIVPWLGVVWWGAAAAEWLLAYHPSVIQGPLSAAAHPLAVLGRWSLSFYMLHQPVLIGLVWLVTILRH
jgi:uncharacterized membrane protein